jgi:hypothetical protein
MIHRRWCHDQPRSLQSGSRQGRLQCAAQYLQKTQDSVTYCPSGRSHSQRYACDKEQTPQLLLTSTTAAIWPTYSIPISTLRVLQAGLMTYSRSSEWGSNTENALSPRPSPLLVAPFAPLLNMRSITSCPIPDPVSVMSHRIQERRPAVR